VRLHAAANEQGGIVALGDNALVHDEGNAELFEPALDDFERAERRVISLFSGKGVMGLASSWTELRVCWFASLIYFVMGVSHLALLKSDVICRCWVQWVAGGLVWRLFAFLPWPPAPHGTPVAQLLMGKNASSIGRSPHHARS
jgi:hypothetical protein